DPPPVPNYSFHRTAYGGRGTQTLGVQGMRSVLHAIPLAVLGCIATAACSYSAQREGPNTASAASPAPYTGKEEPYASERRALGVGVEGVSGTLKLGLANGQTFQLINKIEDGDEYRRYIYDRYLPEAGLHVVTVALPSSGSR